MSCNFLTIGLFLSFFTPVRLKETSKMLPVRFRMDLKAQLYPNVAPALLAVRRSCLGTRGDRASATGAPRLRDSAREAEASQFFSFLFSFLNNH